MKALLIVVIGLYAGISHATEPDTTRISGNTKELDEVVVTSSYLSRQSDHILAVPTKEQRKHAVTGYDLLNNLMVPGVFVDCLNGSVTTFDGDATLYIDGRKAEFREVQSLRPKDISHVEYFDIPTGKYAKDTYSINIVMKHPDNGGYTQLDAYQGLGYLNGDYNLISKYVTGTRRMNLWAGYSLENSKSSLSEYECFYFPTYQLNREQDYSDASNRESEKYVQASIGNNGSKYIWMLRGGMSWTDKRENVANGVTSYWLTDASTDNSSMLNIDSRSKTLRPSIYYYGQHTFSDTKMLDYDIDTYYSRNDYNRLYDENDASYNTVVKENFFCALAKANYSMSFSHGNSLAFYMYESLRVSDSKYTGTSAYNQNLYSSETIFFSDYSQRLGKLFIDFNPGLSFLTYRLKGMKSINHLTPRLQTRVAYMISRTQQLQFSFSLGNTYPRINTINNVEQQIDPVIILKGNPEMNNSILLMPRVNYTLGLGKIALQAGASYFYHNHAIISDYYVRNKHIINTFRDDCIYHRPDANVSVTYKPSGSLNMKLSGRWIGHYTCGGVEQRNLSSVSGSAVINYFFRDFSFGASLVTPSRDLVDGQIYRNTFWKYQLSAMWKHGSWAVKVNADNLFLSDNKIENKLSTQYYAFVQTDKNRSYNQYASLKIVYSIDYGKKTTKSPDYKHKDSQSAILK